MSQDEAHGFLQTVLALSLDLLVPSDDEERRLAGPERLRAERVCAFLAQEIGLRGLLGAVTVEIDQVLAQRKIMVDRAHELLRLAANAAEWQGKKGPDRLRRYLRAVQGPSRLSHRHRTPEDYRQALLTGANRA